MGTVKFVAISDTHGQHRKLNLPEGDVLIHAGDFCQNGSTEDLHDFLSWFSGLDFDHKIFIGGNHDFFAEKDEVKFKKLVG